MSTKQDPSPKKINKTEVKKQKTKNKKRDWSFYAIIACLIIIAIPTVFLGYHIISAKIGTGKALVGNRFDGDLDPAITKENMDTLKTNLEGLEGVESASVDLKTATLRISLKVAEDFDKDSYSQLADTAYEQVNGVTPIETYFTATDKRKMYDLEINVYNILKPTEEQLESFVYYLKSKSSGSENQHGSFLTDTQSPDFVKELIEEQTAPSEPTEEPEATDA